MSEISSVVLAVFFLATLALIHALRRKVRPEETSSYNRMSNGAMLLAGVSVANLFYNSGLLSNVPVIGDHAAAGFILWGAAMVGVVMLVNGVSHWLPISQRHKQAIERRQSRLELIDKMSRFMTSDSRADAVLSAAIRFIAQHLSYSRTAVFTISQKTGDVCLVSAHAKAGLSIDFTDLEFNPRTLDRLAVEKPADTLALFTVQPGTVSLPRQVVPLTVGSRPVGFFLLWEDDTMIDSQQSMATVEQIARMISNHITSQRLTIETNYRRRREQLQSALMAKADPTAALNENFASLARIILDREPLSMVTLTLPKHWPGPQRFTVSSNDASLQEKNVCPDLTDDVLQELFEHGQPVTVRNSPAGHPDWIRPFVPGEITGTALLLPIIVREQVQAIVTFSMDSSRSLSAAQRSILRAVADPVATILQAEHFRLQAVCQLDRLARLKSFIKSAAAANDAVSLYQRTALLLAENLECSLVRISTLDKDGRFMTSRALRTNHTVESITPADGSMILSLLPLHREVCDSRESRFINQAFGAQTIEESERRHALCTTLGSALLVPVVRDGRTAAIISIAEQRDYHRSHLSNSDILFVESIAAALSLAPVDEPIDEDVATKFPYHGNAGALSYVRVLEDIESGRLAINRARLPKTISDVTLLPR